jgi:Flp pilus assembly protein TadB
MARSDEERWNDLVAELRQEDIRFARRGAASHADAMREPRRWLVWLSLGVAYAVLVVGMATKFAPFVVIGVVLASAGGLYDYRWAGRRGPGLPHRR